MNGFIAKSISEVAVNAYSISRLLSEEEEHSHFTFSRFSYMVCTRGDGVSET